MKFDELLERIAAFHRPIAPLFGSAQALAFMHQESRILLEVLRRLRGQGVTTLPVHDCVLVRRDWADVAKTTMEAVFKEQTGVEGVATVEYSSS